jgi:hypothetical protein
MGWVPTSAWLTKLQINSSVADLSYDLAVDASGQGAPSRLAAGLDPSPPAVQLQGPVGASAIVLLLLALPLTVAVRRLGWTR